MKNIFLSLIIFFWKILVSIPRRFHSKLALRISRLMNVFLKKRNVISKKNIDRCFANLSDKERKNLINQNISKSGSAVFDTGIAWFWSDHRVNKEVNFNITGLKELKKEQDHGNGVLLFFKHSLHLELDARLLGMNLDIYGVERNHNSRFFDKVQKAGRLRGVKDLCDKNNPLKFIKWLKSGKTVLYATDQDYGLNGSEIVDFFNQPAATISAPYKIIERTNCQTYFLNSYIDKNEHKIDIVKIDLDMSSSKEMSQNLNKIMEKFIRIKPAEYLWQHRRFKSTLGKKDFYK